MSVWRVEDVDLQGPYNSDEQDFTQRMCDQHSFDERDTHPPTRGGACALPSANRLFDWFKGYWTDLELAGFHVVEVFTEGLEPDQGKIMGVMSMMTTLPDPGDQVIYRGNPAKRVVSFDEFFSLVGAEL